MSDKVKERLARARQMIKRDIRELDRVIREVASGAASASVSAAAGSKSYTNHSLAELRSLRSEYVARLAQINHALVNGSGEAVRHVVTVRR